jgi:NADH-quinone oxidoreductase subunit L
MSPVQLALLVLLLPLASAAVIALFLRRQGTLASIISVGACTVVAAAAFVLVFGDHRRFPASWEWLQLGDLKLSLGFYFDDLAALMLLIVAIVGLCVHVFSLGYMHEDGAKARYFGGLSIFMFSMLGIVLADNLFMMFIFWELVGFSSYLLINHFMEKQSAADASKKAFIVNRVGDFGFLLGIIWCYHSFGTVNLVEIATKAEGATVAAAIPLLLFCGAVGKSAQMPLHVWLPDAMEGPTPVSALIHAATMVAAGIYMLCRLEPLFAAAPDALQVVMWIGVITAVYAAFCAITQSDIKKVLAYSTLSQLGYMVAAFGLGRLHETQETVQGKADVLLLAGAGVAMFHLMTHAFFKALLFLGSGSVIHGCHHEQNIFKMGGLMKRMKFTFVTFTIGVLAIIGFPLFSGFFSKDSILLLAFEKNRIVFVILAITAAMTAFYMIRLWKLVFVGQPRSEEASHAHESGWSMLLPLLVLAILAFGSGYERVLDLEIFRGILLEVPNGHAHEHGHVVVFATSVAVMLIGGFSAYLFYYKPVDKDALAAKAPGVFSGLSLLKASPDEIYNYYIAKIQDRFALVLNFVDNVFIGGFLVRGMAGLVGLIGLGARALYVGSLHVYVYWFLIGAALVWGFAAGF